jgi:hypothetical protein
VTSVPDLTWSVPFIKIGGELIVVRNAALIAYPESCLDKAGFCDVAIALVRLDRLTFLIYSDDPGSYDSDNDFLFSVHLI